MNNNKPNILFVAPFPPPYSGPENSAKMFIESSVKDVFDLYILNTNFRKSNHNKGEIGFLMACAFFLLNYRLVKSLIQYKPDIVYYYVTATILGWLGKDIWVILLSKLFGAKVVIHMRAGHFRINYNKTNRVFKRIIKSVIKLNTFNLAQSSSLSKQYAGIASNEKIGYIHNMIDIERYNNESPFIFQDNLVFFMGHLSHAKGYCDILSIIPDVVKECPEVVFCFAGTPIKEERNIFVNTTNNSAIEFLDPELAYNSYIKGRFDKNYKYVGNIGENEKIAWLKKCNVFVLPSYSEGFSMSVLEAIALEKPVITSPVGALKDIIKNGENGFLVAPGNKELLKLKLLKLLKDEKLRNEMAFKNSQVRKMFSINKMEKEYINLFSRII